jgi:hypothetical protein
MYPVCTELALMTDDWQLNTVFQRSRVGHFSEVVLRPVLAERDRVLDLPFGINPPRCLGKEAL